MSNYDKPSQVKCTYHKLSASKDAPITFDGPIDDEWVYEYDSSHTFMVHRPDWMGPSETWLVVMWKRTLYKK